MANLSDQTRKEQVHRFLLDRAGRWVDGTDLANEQVGGSEGLKRLRELRADLAKDGISILTRKHPDPGRDIFQYKLIKAPEQPVPPKRAIPTDEAGRYVVLPKGLAFGEAKLCERCRSQTKRIASKATGGMKLFRDPDDGAELCRGCNGWGIVPTAVAHR